MTDTIHNTILPMTDTTAEPEDYTGEDGQHPPLPPRL